MDQPASLKETLDRILSSLNGDNSESRLQAIQALHNLNYTSEAILTELERLAIKDDHPDIRVAALSALDLATHRHVRSLASKLGRTGRQAFLKEIEDWENSGLLESAQAEVLKRRYNFDITPLPGRPQTAPAKEIPATPKPGGPRPSLLQTLLSETSIKIALYLGAFFVIAAAVILGALVEATRLPILIFGTIIFGGLALAIRRRLPQPSFALFIVFSFLLPITANVIEGSLILSVQANAVYWTFVSLAMAVIWGTSTRFYGSSLFSVTAFIALATAFYQFAGIFIAEPELDLTMTGIAALAGLFGTRSLKNWKNTNFALPLFISAQILQGIVLLASFGIWFSHQFNSNSIPFWNMASLVTWGLAFVFYAWSDALYPFIFFRWFAAATLIPIPWFGASVIEARPAFNLALFFIWGTILGVSSEFAYRIPTSRKYNLPILIASVPSFVIAILIGFGEQLTFGFTALLGLALAYGAIHAIRPRLLLWAASLLAVIGAYFTFLELPFLKHVNIYFGYELVALSLLFLLPDVISKAAFGTDKAWRMPPRIYGAIFTAICIPYLITDGDFGRVAICFSIFTAFFGIFTLVQRKALLGYLPAAFLPASIFYILRYFEIDGWLPLLMILALLYFAIGFVIRNRADWSQMFRGSALALGTLVSLAALITRKETSGWYAIMIGFLFVAELLQSRNGWSEIGAPMLFSIGAYGVLRDYHSQHSVYYLLVISLIWLVSDMLGHKSIKEVRPLKWFMRGTGGLLVLGNGLYVFYDGILNNPLPAAICFGIYSLFFLIYSLFYEKPLLGYVFTGSFPLFVFFLWREIGFEKWLFPLILIAIAYYAFGYFMQHTGKTAGWTLTLLNSGLGLGTIIAFLAPFQSGLDSSLPVALAATLWAVEAFARRNVWLGFPANVLYLLAYFTILIELKVDEPQYFSMGAAILGMIMHYLLTRAGSRTGAFLTGMVSQLALLGTTYVQMLDTEELVFFVILFFQSLVVMTYGLIIRSRSLVLTPLIFSVLGVVTVIYSALKGISTVVLIGCTGIILLMLGILAILMRERITRLGERLSGWQA